MTLKDFEESIKELKFFPAAQEFGSNIATALLTIRDGSHIIMSIPQSVGIASIYRIIKVQIQIIKPKRLYVAIDYPAYPDHGMKHDFQAVFEIEYGVAAVYALPYNRSTGERMETVSISPFLTKLLKEFKIGVGLKYKEVHHA